MGSVRGSLTTSPLVPWNSFRCTLAVCVQLLLITFDSTEAGRTLQQQGSHQRRLQAYSDGTCTNPRHAPPVQSFQVSDGSWVDCVPIEGQISAHHPALKDHIIPMSPSSPRRSSRRSALHLQLFAREHGACPEGSIPVQRADPNRPLLHKTQSPLSAPAASDAATGSHEYATTNLRNVAQAYSGAHSILSVNGPALEDQAGRDFSLSQLWIVDGARSDDTLSTIEVGWQKFPSLHGKDTSLLAPYLFVYWTNNGYNQTNIVKGSHGCYNLDCPGFVQTHKTWVINGAMPAYTTLAENAEFEYEVEIEVLYNASDSNWWLYLENESVGYWPSAIYNGPLQGSARRISWGGEVLFYKDAANPLVHSKTTMGSGAFPEAGYPVAAYQRNISYADLDGTFYSPDPAVLGQETNVDDPLCYDIAIQQGSLTTWGTYFFFGGSGGNNPGCVGKP